MKETGAEKWERKELKTWMSSAFEIYATRFAGAAIGCPPDETPQQHQTRIHAYGEAFGNIILGKIEMDDIAELLNDLVHLRTSKCPALDLVDLMLVCTEDFSMRTADLLLRVGIRKKDLSALQCTLDRVALEIKLLGQPALPTLDHIEEKFSDKHDQQRVCTLFKTLPADLRYMSMFLNNYPPKPDRITAANQDHFGLGWLYLLVAHYGLGSAAVSHLLKAMRCARESISHPKNPRHHRSFDEKAIERRLSRYWKVVGGAAKFEMEFQVFMYAEFPSYKKLSLNGKTLLSLLLHLEKDYEANAPGFFARLAAEKKVEQK
jgi:hypothetical protein